jgi:hypothetical protein
MRKPKKAHEIAICCDFDIVVFFRVRKSGCLSTYKSITHEDWSGEDCVFFFLAGSVLFARHEQLPL